MLARPLSNNLPELALTAKGDRHTSRDHMRSRHFGITRIKNFKGAEVSVACASV
jgi:hypothetical protein